MATIKVKQASINELRSAIMFAAEQADEAAEMVSKSLNNISDMSFLAKPSLESELSSLKNRLTRQARLSRDCCRAMQETVDLIVQVDNLSGTSSKATWSKFRAQSGESNIILGIPSSIFAVQESLRRRSEINDGFIDGTSGSGITTTPSTGGNGQGSILRSSEFDWTRQLNYGSQTVSVKVKEPIVDANGYVNDTVTISLYNIPQSQVSCTYYTLRKLNDRGLGYPFKHPGSVNGKEWFNNCTDDVPKAPGNDAIESLLSGRDSLENVVVSFPGSDLTGGCGHVMLIDKVYRDPSTGQIMVSSSDHCDFGTGKYLSDPNGTIPAATRTLEAFKDLYFSNHRGMVGAVLIGS